MPGTLHEDLCTFVIISPSVFLIMKSVSEKRCRENQNPHFTVTFNNFCETHAIYEINFCRAGETTDDNTIRCIRCSCWTTKATNALSKHVIFIAFPLQQLLRERGSILCCMYIAYLVGSAINP